MKKLAALIVAVMMMAGCVSAFAADKTVTKEEAVQAVLDYTGLKADQVTFTRVHQDFDDGMRVWDIEFYSGGVEYEFNVDMKTGRIVEADRDYDRDRDDDWDDIFDFD